MINLFVLHIKCLYCSSFSSFKCLNLNPIMLGVVGPDDLGQLTLFLSSIKCLNLNPIMPGILGPDDLGQLTLFPNSTECLNLNSIMTGVLGPDDLGQLTLVLSFFKYLNSSLSILLKFPFGLVIFIVILLLLKMLTWFMY